ncbi:MAG TPA: M20/M25/M40 family metallo-hydrolase [Arenibaculum sp.]|nr:M20/M25/M40 family metallo-hydrolase [Arenibaculum sp.]
MAKGKSSLAALVVLCAFGGAAGAADVPADEILARAEAERTAFVQTWEKLVNVDTGTGHGPGLSEVEAMLVEHLENLGAEVEVTPAEPSTGNNIVGTLQGTGDVKFLLMVHYDTVFEPGTAAERPFRTDENRAYGPGVADAKGGLAVILHSLELLRDFEFDGYGTITVLFNPDEETGSAGSRDTIAELARQQDYVFSYEPPDTQAVTTVTNGINYVFLDVKGRASHAGSAPEEGRNAVIELAHQLVQLNDLGNPEKGTTVNWTIVEGGEKRNIIPSSARAEGDMRYSDFSEYDRVLADARQISRNQSIPDTEVEFRIERGRPPLARNEGSEQLAATAARLHGEIGRDLDAIAMRFGTDAGYAYVPDSPKPAVLETMGLVGVGLHSPEEYAELSSIAPRLYLTTRLIMELSQ